MNIRILLYTLLISMPFILSAAPDKKDKNEQKESLEEWTKRQKSTLPAIVDGVTMMRPDYYDDRLTVNELIDCEEMDKEEIFINALSYVIDNMDKETESLKSIDFETFRFLLSRGAISKDGKEEYSYDYEISFQHDDALMSFLASGISAKYKMKGLIPKTSSLESLKPQENETHADIIETFAWVNSKYISDMTEYIKKKSAEPVTHWSEIKRSEVVKGMNQTEVKLILGRPSTIRPSGDKVKWMMNNDYVIIFTDGIVSNIIN